MLLAPALLLGELPELLTALPLETADAASRHDQGCARVRGHGGQVDFPEVNGRLSLAGGLFRLLHFYADVQLKAPVPDERAGSNVLGKGDGQNERRVAFAHRQNDATLLAVDGLGGPLDRIEAFLAPGILHAHLGMPPAQRMGRLDICEKGVNDLLHGLSIEGEPAFGCLFQLTPSRPFRMARTRLLVQHHAAVPHAGRFLLRRFEATEAGGRQIGQAIHANGLHTNLFSLSARKTVMGYIGSEPVTQQPGDDSPWLQARGFWNDTGVSSHTVRSVHAQKRDKLKATSVSHGTMRNAGAFLPTTLRRGTQRNTLQFGRCKRTIYLFFAHTENVEMVSPPTGGAAFIPRRERRGLSPRFGNKWAPSEGAHSIYTSTK